jgi:hypothetical protein
MLHKRTEIAQTALGMRMWAQDKDRIRATYQKADSRAYPRTHLSESCFQGLAKSPQKHTKN